MALLSIYGKSKNSRLNDFNTTECFDQDIFLFDLQTDVEMESIPDEERHSDANIVRPGLQSNISGEAVVDNASHYQTLSSATRSTVEAQPPQLYEPLITESNKPKQSEYASLQSNSRLNPEDRDGDNGSKTKKQTSDV